MKIASKNSKWCLAARYILHPYNREWGAFMLLALLVGCLPAMVFYRLAFLVDHISLVSGTTHAISQDIFSMLGALVLALLGINIMAQVQYMLLYHLRDHIRFSVKRAFLRSILDENDLAVLESRESVALLAETPLSFENLGTWIDQLGAAMMSAATVFFLLLLGFTLEWWIPPLLLLTTLPSAIIRYKIVVGSFNIVKVFAGHHHRLSVQEKIITQPAFFKEVRLFGLKEYLLSLWEKDSRECIHTISRFRINGFIRTTLAALLSSIATAICVGYLAWMVMAGLATTGAFAIIVGIVLQLNVGLNSFVYSVSRTFETSRHVMPLLALIDKLSAAYDKDSIANMAKASNLTASHIEVLGVSFMYPDAQKYSLREISLTIKSGSKIAIVGENGAGKTTLIKLLTGLLSPTQGYIKIDGENLESMDKSQFWAGIGAVFQDHARFPLSASLNVALGHINRLDEQEGIDFCLAQVGLADLQTQLNASVDDTYSEPAFSGGQWQRLALARALFRANDTRFVVLDEPTSALDPNSEYALFEKFLELAQGKTTIFVTHRLALAREADTIVVLDQGSIVETGHHDQLIMTGGPYSVMFERQASRYTDSSISVQSDEPENSIANSQYAKPCFIAQSRQTNQHKRSG